MKLLLLKILILLLTLLTPSLLAIQLGSWYSHSVAMGEPPSNSIYNNLQLPPPNYDPAKPVAVVLLAADMTEVTDFLAPYEILSLSQKYNVLAVAPQRQLTTLTGGLDIMPHYSLAEYAGQIKVNPALVVVPHMPNIKSAQNKPILDWLKALNANNSTVILSWCAGSLVLAEAGLLNNLPATTHWGEIDQTVQDYPQVKWQRGVRYVDNGRIITGAGLTSGYDTTLYFLKREFGMEVAQSVAKQLNYNNLDFVNAPQLEQYKIGAADGIYLLNNMYKWEKQHAGVFLYEGVEEGALAAVLDTYAASFTTRLTTVATVRQPLKTQFGLYLLPRTDFNSLGHIDRVLVAGTKAKQLTAQETNNSVVVYLHKQQPERFVYAAPLEDLARQQDKPTAEFGRKRLEYRSDTVKLEGAGWPLAVLLRPVLIIVLSIGLTFWLYRRLKPQMPRRPVIRQTQATPALVSE